MSEETGIMMLTKVIGGFVLLCLIGMAVFSPKMPTPPPPPAAPNPKAAAPGAHASADPAAGLDPDLPIPPGFTREQAAALIAAHKKNSMLSGGGQTNFNALKTTLRGIAMSQEIYMNDRNTYAKDSALLYYKPEDPRIKVEMVDATSGGWSPSVSMTRLKGSCVVRSG